MRYSDDDNENARWMKNAPSLTPTLSLIASSVGKFFEPPSLPPPLVNLKCQVQKEKEGESALQEKGSSRLVALYGVNDSRRLHRAALRKGGKQGMIQRDNLPPSMDPVGRSRGVLYPEKCGEGRRMKK